MLIKTSYHHFIPVSIIIIIICVFHIEIYAEEKIPPIDTGASCITSSCHEDIGKKKYVHGVGVDGKHCIKCHDVVNEGEHSFTLPSKSIELCVQCHSGQYLAPSDIKGDPKKVVITMGDVFEGEMKTVFHRPFFEGKCTSCHNPHESDFYMHLKGSYPRGLYATYTADSYGLCIICHKDFDKVLTEPRTLSYTGFRNGNLNLHYRHINREKGRTCRICHHPHGSENPKLIKDGFKFGIRELSIEFKKTDTGGSCAPSCHIPISYDRYAPVDILMKVTPRLGQDAEERELIESRKKYLQEKKEAEESVEAEEVNKKPK
jgi:predicted CXXCH cytochrome family protein